MGGVESPEDRPGVREAVDPILTELRDQHGENELKPEGPRVWPKRIAQMRREV